MSFAMLRALNPLPYGAAEWRMLGERLDELAAGAAAIAGDAPRLLRAHATLAEVAAGFRTAIVGFADRPLAVSGPAAPAPTPGKAPPAVKADGIETVHGRALTLHFEAKRCIHARFCVTGLPHVFQANVEGDWIDPDAASTEALVGVAHACPSGAIRYTRHDGGAEETPPEVNMLRIRENGPYAVHADIKLAGHAPMTRATLCRCGLSKSKPFCDNSHIEGGFAATGEPATRESQPLDPRGGPLSVAPQKNGPLVVRGPLEICAGTGRTVDRITTTRLCRCGGSRTKPFCDGSHTANGFIAD
jgi:CDGSH-type Zn-finger protein/uncharacterized Fe-S cluster protein YjdI